MKMNSLQMREVPNGCIIIDAQPCRLPSGIVQITSKGCGKQERGYEANEVGKPIPCELLVCGEGWLCDSCAIKEASK